MYDVIIIGSGGAGLSAALEAKKRKLKTLVISKTYPTHSQTVQAQGGINAVLYEGEDNVNQHIEDTYIGSAYLSNKEHIKYMCKDAKETILWLDKIGVPFSKTSEGNFQQRKFGGTKKIRTCYSSDYTGLKILHTLYDQCIKEGIEFLNETTILSLIKEDNICKGIVSYSLINGEVEEYYSKSIVLAMGGYAGIYHNFTSNSYSNTSDALALAFNSKVDLSNLEFVQFHPTCLENSNILISESARAEGAKLLDINEERFIDELETRDTVARAINKKIHKDGKVYLDLRALGNEKINTLLPQEKRLAKEFSNIDISKELLPINPAAHYSMGGIATNLNGETSLKNLFAIGECAQGDIHGANRLGGNSLLEITSLSRKCIKELDLKIDQKISNTNVYKDKYKEKISSILNKKNQENFYKLKDDLGKILFKNVSLVRNEKSLNETLKSLKEIKNKFSKCGVEDKSKIFNKNLLEYLEFENELISAQLICEAALFRKESRGSHYRDDYPEINKTLNKKTIIRNENEKTTIIFEEIQ